MASPSPWAQSKSKSISICTDLALRRNRKSDLRKPRAGISRTSWRFRQCVFKLVGVLPVGNFDGHHARQPHQLPRPWVRHYAHLHLVHAPRHCAAVLQDEAAAVSLHRSRNSLHRHIAARTRHARHGRQHLPFAGCFQVAMKLLIERHSSQTLIPPRRLEPAALPSLRTFHWHDSSRLSPSHLSSHLACPALVLGCYVDVCDVDHWAGANDVHPREEG